MRIIPIILSIMLLGLVAACAPRPADEPAAAAAAKPTNTPRPGPAPTPGPEQRQAAQWEEFTHYGPQLAASLNRSEEINRQVATAAGIVSPATVTNFYRAVEAAEGAQREVGTTAGRVQTPREANAFKKSVTDALILRQTAMRQLKEALAKPGVAANAEYARTKEAVDRSTTGVVVELAKLCREIGAEYDECTGALGWAG
jgi:hypothetical protein